MESILTSIKKLVGGIQEECEAFDDQIIMHINSVFMDLEQMGIGPVGGFSIEDKTSVWTDYIPEANKYEAVKSYMGLRVKLLFDPPQSSSVIQAIQRDLDRWEFRLNVAAEN